MSWRVTSASWQFKMSFTFITLLTDKIWHHPPTKVPLCEVALVVKNLAANTGDIRDLGLIPGFWRYPGGNNGNPLQYSCLENPHEQKSQSIGLQRVRHDWSDSELSTNKSVSCGIQDHTPRDPGGVSTTCVSGNRQAKLDTDCRTSSDLGADEYWFGQTHINENLYSSTVFMEEKFHNSIGVKKEKYKFVFIGMSKKNFISIIPSPKAA